MLLVSLKLGPFDLDNRVSYTYAILGFQADLQKKLSTIEADNKTIRDEFNIQRAKLKELFLQKEGD